VGEKLKTAKQAHEAFYADLGKQIEDIRRDGPTEFIIQGDFDATVVRGVQDVIRPEDKQLSQWCNLHGLVIAEF
jgi:hypothetical protein